jgi:predicted transcriptional regulator of viral defense system
MRGKEYVTRTAAAGRHHFATRDLVEAQGGSAIAARAMLRRLRDKGEIATPCRGFHVIVPPEYRSLACLPPEQFVPQLMGHLGLHYYVALLSAARYYGAAHQQPQVFQVIVEVNRPSISCGRVLVDFFARRNAGVVPTLDRHTPRGYVRVSSPETTAFDLVGYMMHSGGLDNVATALRELAQELDPERLVAAAPLSPVAWAQRLGYLLDLVGAGTRVGPLHKFVRQQAREYRPLVPGLLESGGSRSTEWRLMLNVQVEED